MPCVFTHELTQIPKVFNCLGTQCTFDLDRPKSTLQAIAECSSVPPLPTVAWTRPGHGQMIIRLPDRLPAECAARTGARKRFMRSQVSAPVQSWLSWNFDDVVIASKP